MANIKIFISCCMWRKKRQEKTKKISARRWDVDRMNVAHKLSACCCISVGNGNVNEWSEEKERRWENIVVKHSRSCVSLSLPCFLLLWIWSGRFIDENNNSTWLIVIFRCISFIFLEHRNFLTWNDTLNNVKEFFLRFEERWIQEAHRARAHFVLCHFKCPSLLTCGRLFCF